MVRVVGSLPLTVLQRDALEGVDNLRGNLSADCVHDPGRDPALRVALRIVDKLNARLSLNFL